MDEFIGKSESTYRDISIRIEEGSVASLNKEIKDFVSIQPYPFWSSDEFVHDFFLVRNTKPTVKDAFENAKERVRKLERKVDLLNKKYPEHRMYLNSFKSSLSKTIKNAEMNFKKKYSQNFNDIYTFDSHYNLISSTLINSALGNLAELKVALTRHGVVAQSFYPFLNRGLMHKDASSLYESLISRLDTAVMFYYKNIQSGNMSVKRMRQMYPILSSSVHTDDVDVFIKEFVMHIQNKEFDILSFDDATQMYSFVEVKHSEKTVGNNKSARDSILRQAKMTFEIFKFIGVKDKVVVEMAAPFGIDRVLADALRDLDVIIDGGIFQK